VNKSWGDAAWEEYIYRQLQDKKALRRINVLLKDIDRNGYNCAGKPEQLKGDLSGWRSVRIDAKNRLVFRIINDLIEIAGCRGHYNDT
jgi:toxin YoeB